MRNICVVDDDISTHRIVSEALDAHYAVTLLASTDSLFRTLESEIPDLILLGIEMPQKHDLTVMYRLSADAKAKDIPVIFLTAHEDTSHEDTSFEARALEAGVVDFLSKPFSPELLLLRVKLHLEISEHRKHLQVLVDEETRSMESLQDALSLNIAELIGLRDGYTGGHVKRSCAYLEILLDNMASRQVYAQALTPDFVRAVLRAGPLHDIGKVGIGDAVLSKAGKIEGAEMTQMRLHTELGGQTLLKAQEVVGASSFLAVAHDMALYHHEKWDGTGYMEGLCGEQIPLCARIMSIVDVYDALTSRRPYKEPFAHEVAVECISKERGKAFDPALTDVFMDCHTLFYERLIKFQQEDFDAGGLRLM